MNPRWYLGNDVVDTGHRGGRGRAKDDRFLARVCSPSEHDRVRSSSDPDRALWIHWAGKEAIYKSTSKALGAPPVFHHSSFRVTFPKGVLESFLLGPSSQSPPTLMGTGTYEDLTFALSVEELGPSVHAVSWLNQGGAESPRFQAVAQESAQAPRGPKDPLEPHFSPGEWGCITHRASALTRIETRRAIARSLGVSEEVLEIRCGPGLPGRRIPSVWSRGEELPLDLTLSHHGRFLAWAFLSSPPQRSQGR